MTTAKQTGSFSRQKVSRMVQLALFSAIILVMAFTPLGYLKIGVLSITFITIPVVVGAILLGPGAGAFLGGVFGLTSFVQCFGMDDFGTALFGINPVFTFIMCVAARILMGFLTGLIFQALYKVDKTKIWCFAAASLSGAVLNTVLFMGCLVLFFGRSDYILNMQATMGVNSVMGFLVAMVGLNGVLEAAVCLVAGGAIGKALHMYLTRRSKV